LNQSNLYRNPTNCIRKIFKIKGLRIIIVLLLLHYSPFEILAIPSKKEKKHNAKNDTSGFKKELKKIDEAISFKHLFHHSDSVKRAKHFIHEQHALTKGKKPYPYQVKLDPVDLKKVKYRDTSDYALDYEIFGWYPYWETDYYKGLNFSLLTTLAYFSYEVDPKTGLAKTTHDWETSPAIDAALSNNTKVLLTVTNFGSTNNKQFLSNALAISTLVDEVKKLIKKRKAHGVCLDFEGVAKSQRSAYARFIVLLSQELKKENSNYLIYLTAPAVDWAKSIDFQTLEPVVDRWVIMGYGYYGSTSSSAGPVDLLSSGNLWEPLNLNTSVNYYVANEIPPSKLILALPFYGSIWTTKSREKASTAKRFIGYRTYNYIKSKIKAPLQYDSISQSAWYSYVVENETQKFRQCWFENPQSLGIKLNYIKSRKLAGAGIWALGFDKGYPDLWQTIAQEMCDTIVRNTQPLPESAIGTGIVESSPNGNNSKKNTPDTSNDPSQEKSSEGGLEEKITGLEVSLSEVSNYPTLFVYILLFAVAFGGIGFVIALFSPNTRIFFFSPQGYVIFFGLIFLLFLLVLLRMTHVIEDSSTALIAGFLLGSVSIYFIVKQVKRHQRNLP
jgi:chitinase